MTGPPALLCVANFPSGTGYAWDFIESLYGGLADRLEPRGIPCFVAYPRLDAPPRALTGTAARPVEAAFRPGRPAGTLRACRLIRRMGVRVLYLSDRPAWHASYALLRLAGVRRIIVHDHTSGERTRPGPMRRVLKRARNSIPGCLADHVIAVSDFVARRKRTVDLVPAERVERIWNSIEIPPDDGADVDSKSRSIRRELGLSPTRPIVACACRASPSKGVDHLFLAFDRLAAGYPPDAGPVLLYAGEGPMLDELRSVRDGLAARADIHILGYRTDAPDLLGAAHVVAVPSTWAEAFGLAALEPMSRGRPVVASRSGGLSEVVSDGETGLLVAPRDVAALAAALAKLIDDDELREEMGRNARRRARNLFAREQQLDRLEELVVSCFSGV